MPEPHKRTEAVVPILRKNGRVLVIKRAEKVVMPGYWCPPSGGIEAGESQAEAVVRETAEELGIPVKPIAKVWECPTHDGTFTLHWWIAEPEADELHPNPDEVAEIRWVTTEEFLDLDPTFEGDREFFERVLPALDAAGARRSDA